MLRLSRFIPVPMRSTYGVHDGRITYRERAVWIHWRGRALAVHRYRVT